MIYTWHILTKYDLNWFTKDRLNRLESVSKVERLWANKATNEALFVAETTMDVPTLVDWFKHSNNISELISVTPAAVKTAVDSPVNGVRKQFLSELVEHKIKIDDDIAELTERIDTLEQQRKELRELGKYYDEVIEHVQKGLPK